MSEQETPLDSITSHLQNAKHRDHSHKNLAQIKREQDIGPLESLLLWLAKADLYVVSISTRHSRSILSGLGAMVIFTGLLAFSTSLYTLLSTLIGQDAPYRWPVAIFLACIYTYGIILIDREIVGATNTSWKNTLVRLVFAVFIAFAVSYPAKLKFFEARINAEIGTIINERNIKLLERMEAIRGRAEDQSSTVEQNLQANIDAVQSQIKILQSEIDAERARGGCGPKCSGWITKEEGLRAQLEELRQQGVRENSAPSLSQSEMAEISKIEEQLQAEKNKSIDILYRMEALDRIMSVPGSSAPYVSWFLIGFFLLLEMVPLALKWSIGHTEYHNYINARNMINNQKIVSATNVYLEMMRDNPESVFTSVPLEVTDIIAMLLEDESHFIKTPNRQDLFRSVIGTIGLAGAKKESENSPSQTQNTDTPRGPSSPQQDPPT